jgi:hypothetical protein
LARNSARYLCRIIRQGLLIAPLVACIATPLEATQDIEISKDFRVSRDFADFRIERSSSVFFDDEKVFVGSTPTLNRMYSDELRDIAREQLRSVVSLGPRGSATYNLLIRMESFTNYAIRNTERKPSKGSVVFAVCRLPAKRIEDDCQNLTFYFFDEYERRVMFSKAMSMWLDRILPPR